MTLNHEDLEKISELTADKILEKRRAQWVDPETHYKDHIWIASQKKEEADRKALRKKLFESAAIWALLILLGFVCKAAYNEILHIFSHKGP